MKNNKIRIQPIIPSLKRLYIKVAKLWKSNNIYDLTVKSLPSPQVQSSEKYPLVSTYLRRRSLYNYTVNDLNNDTIKNIMIRLFKTKQIATPLESIQIGTSIVNRSMLLTIFTTTDFTDWECFKLLEVLSSNNRLVYNLSPYLVFTTDNGLYLLNRMLDGHY